MKCFGGDLSPSRRIRSGALKEFHSVGTPLSGSFDAEACAREIPSSFVLKGMFFSRFVRDLGSDWSDLAPSLDAPPKNGRYVAFSDYPQRDFVRIYCRVARKSFARYDLSEAVRRLAREDFHVFAESTFGKVVLALVRDARSALHRVPFVYSKVAPGEFRMHAEDIDDRTVRIVVDPHHGNWEYQLGQFEGIVLAFDATPRISVERVEMARRFDIQID